MQALRLHLNRNTKLCHAQTNQMDPKYMLHVRAKHAFFSETGLFIENGMLVSQHLCNCSYCSLHVQFCHIKYIKLQLLNIYCFDVTRKLNSSVKCKHTIFNDPTNWNWMCVVFSRCSCIACRKQFKVKSSQYHHVIVFNFEDLWG